MPSPEDRHYIEWHDVGGVMVVRFATTFLRDERVIRTVFDELDDLVASGRKKVLIDFSGLEAFASYAIGKLLKLNDRLRAEGRLALCCLTPIVDEIIDIMNLRKTFHVYPDERAGLESFV
jgi:anti-sigma B factor antagonist